VVIRPRAHPYLTAARLAGDTSCYMSASCTGAIVTVSILLLLLLLVMMLGARR
jgi:hypothetical protein